MADEVSRIMVDFRTEPAKYKHWKLSANGPVATLAMDVKEDGGLRPGYELKLNSYDLGVDVELYDAIQRLRFEHPEVGAVIVTSAKDRVFCAGANIRMLSQSAHGWKVNFCKFTNETRNAIEEATGESRQFYLCSVNGPCAGGGYELALATDWIVMADDGNTAVSLPEVPLLAVLPGTGGLTRLVDKRRVRRDRADFFCTVAEGIKGARAVEWGLVDEVVPRPKLDEVVQRRAAEFAARTDRPAGARGIALSPLERSIDVDRIRYGHVACVIDRARGLAEITVSGPSGPPPADAVAIREAGVAFWPLALARELDDLILHLRTNEDEIGLWVFKTSGRGDLVEAYDRVLAAHRDDWLVREIRLYLKRTFKRVEVSSRSRPTTSTGTTKSASRSRSARLSHPTRSPAWRRRSGSAGPRRSRARSSAGSRPGRTGSSSAATPSGPRARWRCTARGGAASSTAGECDGVHRLQRAHPQQRRPE